MPPSDGDRLHPVGVVQARRGSSAIGFAIGALGGEQRPQALGGGSPCAAAAFVAATARGGACNPLHASRRRSRRPSHAPTAASPRHRPHPARRRSPPSGPAATASTSRSTTTCWRRWSASSPTCRRRCASPSRSACACSSAGRRCSRAGCTRFSTMPPDEARAYLERSSTPAALRAALVLGLRTLVFLAFYQHPDVLADMGVDWQGRAVALTRRRAELLASPAAEATARHRDEGRSLLPHQGDPLDRRRRRAARRAGALPGGRVRARHRGRRAARRARRRRRLLRLPLPARAVRGRARACAGSTPRRRASRPTCSRRWWRATSC